MFTDIVDCAKLKNRHGVPAFSAALRVHNDHFERLARECHLHILQNLGDGYFAEADSVVEVVRFALLFQEAMRRGPWSGVRLTTRVGIHAGEITAIPVEGGSGIVAPAADLTARVMSLALGGQILLTRFPFDEARYFLREHPHVPGRDRPPLRWLAHGPYLLKGREEPMEIFEVGAEGLAPLTPPPDSEKANRAIRPGEEATLGWRPAIGLEVPGRPGWRLLQRLGAGAFGEVWAGEHVKLHHRRAFKFCFDDERLRALKREVTLVRLLHTALGERDDIVRYHELKLDEAPFYLESDLAPHGNLLQWAERQGGLAAIPLAQRIALVANTATALAAAHSVGVLHKDIKPTNILIFDGSDGTLRPRLVDFGIGTLADPTVLSQHGVSADGFTRGTFKPGAGTPVYSPPEYLAGKPYTVQGDIYGLGVVLYQLLTADSSRPIAPGWERDITDPLLREDIAACVDGDPAHRLPSASQLAERLLQLDQRRAEIAEKERLAREAAARAKAEAAAAAARLRAARLRKLTAAFAGLALLAAAGGLYGWLAYRSAEEHRSKLVRLSDALLVNSMIEEAEIRLWPPYPDRLPQMNEWLNREAELHERFREYEKARNLQNAPNTKGGAWEHQIFQNGMTASTKLFTTTHMEVERRAATARRISAAQTNVAWEDAISSIADQSQCPQYHALTIRPQVGLLPIGRDGNSGLWEFAHLASGALPERTGSGSLALTDSTCLIFVLIPGGTFGMGATKPTSQDQDGPNVDPNADDSFGPTNTVLLTPFFMSKFEMTQAQWVKCFGSNPSQFDDAYWRKMGEATGPHPVEQVTWEQCDLLLPRMGMLLPTEAQWEFAARGGTTTIWWTGNDVDTIGKPIPAGNICDVTARQKANWGDGRVYAPWEDGYEFEAPVGRFRANPFGLHDTIGNVQEWCRDKFSKDYSRPARSGDGERSDPNSRQRPVRGGAYAYDASVCRSAQRFGVTLTENHPYIGVRPMIPLSE